MSIEKEPILNIVDEIYICDPCLDGAGGICWTPGCIMWLKSAPDIPIREQIVMCGGAIQPLDGNSGEQGKRSNP